MTGAFGMEWDILEKEILIPSFQLAFVFIMNYKMLLIACEQYVLKWCNGPLDKEW